MAIEPDRLPGESRVAYELRKLREANFQFGSARRAKEAAAKSPSSGRMLPVVEREMPGSQFVKGSSRRTPPVMGSDKNIARQTIAESKTTPGMAPRPRITPRVSPKYVNGLIMPTDAEMDAMRGRPGETVQYDSGTLNPSEFAPATLTPSGRPQPTMTSMENVDVDRIGRGGFEAVPAPMRRGLFGEEISQADWDAMTQRNKDAAGFWGQFKKGGQVKKKSAKPAKKMARGGSVSSASKRGDGVCQRGKTKGRMV